LTLKRIVPCLAAAIIPWCAADMHAATNATGTPLRDLADARGIGIGAAVATRPLAGDSAYRATLAREMNMIVAENCMKLHQIQPREGQYDFAGADALAAFAASNNMRLRGHTLVWHQSAPGWLKDRQWSRAELLNVLSQHIATVVGRYKGRVCCWDVVNEALDDKIPGLRTSLWHDVIGPDYLDHAFTFAHAADPRAKLFYNDYCTEGLNRKSDEQYAMLKAMLARGVPVHGVGFQCHFVFDSYPAPETLVSNMNRFADLGLETQITELDLRISTPVTPEKLERQARAYGEIFRAALEARNCTAVLTWGLTDKYSWVPAFFKGFDAGLLFDKDYEPKPAHDAVHQALSIDAVSRGSGPKL